MRSFLHNVKKKISYDYWINVYILLHTDITSKKNMIRIIFVYVISIVEFITY